jgi:hypothetical protein
MFSSTPVKWLTMANRAPAQALDQRHVAQLFGEHLEPETLEQIIDAMRVSLKSVFKVI